MNRQLIIRLTIWCTLLMQCIQQGSGQKCQGTASYRMTIKYEWTRARFSNRPPGAHFSPLVLHTHVSRYSAYSVYGYASAGLRTVAETGGTGGLARELQQNKMNKLVGDMVVHGRAPDASDTISVMFNATCRYKYVSMVSMVAPSPDWVVMLVRLRVVQRHQFVAQRNGTLFVYDAGTDSGTSFTADDVVSVPVQNVAPLYGAPFNGLHVASYQLVRVMDAM